MPATPNIITSDDLCKALDIEFVENFRHDYDRFEEILGLFPSEKMRAGSALFSYKTTGELVTTSGTETTGEGNEAVTTDLGTGSSGSEYIEGDFIARSNYKVEKNFFGEMKFMPYAKQTSAQAIIKSGFENAVLRTDKKAHDQLRANILGDFFTWMTGLPHAEIPATETEAARPATIFTPGSTAAEKGLQYSLAMTEAALGDALETGNDHGGTLVHFVNRQDIAKYLATASITTQTAFGMTYIESFLGVDNILITNKIPSGSFYVTPVSNIRIYTLDFAALGRAGLSYTTDSLGLIGVHHKADYDYASAETYLVRGMTLLPEIEDYVFKGVIK